MFSSGFRRESSGIHWELIGLSSGTLMIGVFGILRNFTNSPKFIVESDLVAHCGHRAEGAFIYTLVLTVAYLFDRVPDTLYQHRQGRCVLLGARDLIWEIPV